MIQSILNNLAIPILIPLVVSCIVGISSAGIFLYTSTAVMRLHIDDLRVWEKIHEDPNYHHPASRIASAENAVRMREMERRINANEMELREIYKRISAFEKDSSYPNRTKSDIDPPTPKTVFKTKEFDLIE